MAYKTLIYRDAETEELVLQRVDATTGVALVDGDTGYQGVIRLKLSECIGTDSHYHELYIQETEICVGGVVKRCMLLRSDPFNPP